MNDRIVLQRWQPETDGELTEAGLRQKLESLGYTVTRYDYPPGTCFPEHSHGVDKIDAVLAGRFELIMGDRRVALQAGEWIHVPRGVVHSARVIGHQSVVSLDALKQS